MLVLDGQNTATLQFKVSGQAILQKLTRKDVFVKEADMKIFKSSLNLRTGRPPTGVMIPDAV